MADIYNAQRHLSDRQRRDASRIRSSPGRFAPPFAITTRKLYVINGQDSKIHRQAAQPCEFPKAPNATPFAGSRPARRIRRRRPRRVAGATESGLEDDIDRHHSFWREHSGRRGSRSRCLRPRASAARRATSLSAITPIRAAPPTWACFPTGCRATRRSRTQPSARASATSGAPKFRTKPGLTARAMMEAAVAGKLKALYVVGANPAEDFCRHRAGPHGRPRSARRAGHVPDRNGAARRCGSPRRLHL